MTFDQAQAALGTLLVTLPQVMCSGHRLGGLTQMTDGRWHAGVECRSMVGFGTGRTASEAVLRAAQNCGPSDARAGRGVCSVAADTPESMIEATLARAPESEDIFA